MYKFDYLIVGSGLFGATFAYRAKQANKKCLVIDKRNHIGGNIYCENKHGINVHKYGAHIFHTSNKKVWDFVNSIVEFNRYTNSPVANYKGKLFNLPFNMNTFYQMWGVITPAEALDKINSQRQEMLEKISLSETKEPANLEEQAISLIGVDIYEKLIKGYTEKQWGRKCTELPSFIIKRLKLIEGLLKDIEVITDTDFFENREYWEQMAEKIVFTGKIDEFYDYKFGKLEYRTVYFEEEELDCSNYQGNAVVNYTDIDVPYTRVIEHKHFEMFGDEVDKCKKTVISKEYSIEWNENLEPYYPINNPKNNELYQQYKLLADKETRVIFGGRLAEYKYYDMAPIIEKVLNMDIF